MITALSRANVRDEVGRSLRAALISGELAPGRVYSAPMLAKQLNVSATPVREAMLDLARDGMVEVVPNTGFRVTVVSERDLDELAELRLLIEVPLMTAIAADTGDEHAAAITELRSVTHEMDAAANAGDLLRYLELDTDFHTRFLALHGNEHAVSVIRNLRSRSRLYGLRALADAGLLADSSREHEQMVDAALAHDPDTMQALVHSHIGHVRGVWAAPGVEPER